MRVIVSTAVVRAILDTEEVVKLHRLLSHANTQRHVVLFESLESIEPWLESVDIMSREVYRRSINLSYRAASAYPADAATVQIELRATQSWGDPVCILCLDDALKLLDEPLGVLVENAGNDWTFLCGIMRPSERKRFLKLVAEGWATPLHGGGSDLKNRLEDRFASPFKKLRTFVLFDSDRLHPDEFDSAWNPHQRGLPRAQCQAYGWEKIMLQHLPHRYWMLRRRFIESYMPFSELVSLFGEASDVYQSFSGLTRYGRWYFNMKSGFDGDANRTDKARVKDLFSDVSPLSRSRLAAGFGTNLADQYSNAITNDFTWDQDALAEANEMLPRLMRLI
jgi:hypothetical protein